MTYTMNILCNKEGGLLKAYLIKGNCITPIWERLFRSNIPLDLVQNEIIPTLKEICKSKTSCLT